MFWKNEELRALGISVVVGLVLFAASLLWLSMAVKHLAILNGIITVFLYSLVFSQRHFIERMVGGVMVLVVPACLFAPHAKAHGKPVGGRPFSYLFLWCNSICSLCFIEERTRQNKNGGGKI
jgi:hypothetical protein